MLLLTAVLALGLWPAPWHAALEALLVLRAKRQGWDLQIGQIEGGLFDSTELYDVRCRQRAGDNVEAPKTDFQMARVELVLAWRRPWLDRPEDSWIRRVVIEGLKGTADLSPARGVPAGASVWQMAAMHEGGWRQTAALITQRFVARGEQTLARRLASLDRKLVPEEFSVSGEQFAVVRRRYLVATDRLRLTGLVDEAGRVYARQLRVRGPEFDSTLRDLAGWTYWKGRNLTLGDIDLGRGVHLASGTLQGEHLDRHRLDWEGELRAIGGSARGQGAIDFSRPRLALEIAGSLESMAVPPLARLLGVAAATDGQVQRANFTFRGDPENWTAAEMWLSAEATNFAWGPRRWESLDLQGMVLNRRVQVHRLELRQSGNQLSFTGECALPAAGEAGLALPALAATSWWQAGFSCVIDARIDDLHALAQLVGEQLPALSGRMSINGQLSAHPGTPGIDGYLNVEGSALSIRGAPLESLRTTLLFKGDELTVPDLQATRGGDYLSGKGTLQIIGPARYQGELRATVKDLAVYAPAYADLPGGRQPISGSLQLDWSGDGSPGAHSGAFQGRTEHFQMKDGPVALGRPIDLAADGTYSPESVSFRHLVLQEGAGEKRRDALKLEGALPWTRDPKAFAEGRWLDPARVMSVRIACAEAPLDLLAALAPGLVAGAAGQMNGWLNAEGTIRAPKFDADLSVRAEKIWPMGDPVALENVSARVRVEKSQLSIVEAKARWGGQAFEATGGIDLTDTTKVRLDLGLQGADGNGVDESGVKAGLSYALTLRGVPEVDAVLGGELRLVNGEITGVGPESWVDLGSRLPAAWGAQQVTLHLSAVPALRAAVAGRKEGEVRLDLQLQGALQAPRVTGTVEFSQMPASGTWYYTGQASEDPRVSMTSADADGSRTFVYGPAGSRQMISDVSGIDFALRPDTEPARWGERDEMAAFGGGGEL